MVRFCAAGLKRKTASVESAGLAMYQLRTNFVPKCAMLLFEVQESIETRIRRAFMSDYIVDLRKIVGHRTLLQVGASVIVEDEWGRILLELRTDNRVIEQWRRV